MTQPSVIIIGNFDGVHRGHRALHATARDLARSHNARVVAMTFDPHPNATLDPANQPPRLCALDEKVKRLKFAGADEVVILEPTPKVLGQGPQDFIRQLVKRYRPVAFVEGKDFRFGKDRAGDIPMLNHYGQEHGYEVVIQPSLDVTLSDLTVVTVHSSLIRWLVGQGRVEDAERCLAVPFGLTGTVVKGEQRGRTLGFPTVNLDLDALNDYMLPADGVYAGEARWSGAAPGNAPGAAPGAERAYHAAISVGHKPSFGKVQLTIEAHLLDFTGDLYGQTLTLNFTRWLRDQVRFPSAEALCEQLQRDIQRVRCFEPIPIP